MFDHCAELGVKVSPWMLAAQYQPGMLAASLRHRTEGERSGLAAGILDVATWQAAYAANGLP